MARRHGSPWSAGRRRCGLWQSNAEKATAFPRRHRPIVVLPL